MAVEIWDGTAWSVYKNYSNADGDIAWNSEDLDISSVSGKLFKFRFRAYGGDSQDINRWNIDNVEVVASEPAQQQANCILGYYFYLGNVITGFTEKNAYPIPPELIQYGQTYTGCVRALYGSGYSDLICKDFSSRFLYPVRNIQGYPVESTAFISWEKPLMTSGTSQVTPPGLLGYSVYRNDVAIAQINDPDSLFFYDYNLEPGIYHYGIAAKYDLTPYGFPGQEAQSLPAGPLHITITFGRQIPFFEAWNSGSFSFNEWTLDPYPGNWFVDQSEGNPAPAASFRWQPPMVNYDISLESPAFNGVPYNCAAIWFDFDLKLVDHNSTGNEKMVVEVYYNNEWHKKAEFRNQGNFGWTSSHIDISPVRGKGFRVRFRATGQNSADILHWLVDNISIYPVCYPARHPAGQPIGNIVKLTWNPPVCHSGNLLQEGFESALFPPQQWSAISVNQAAHWTQLTNSSSIGVHSGNHSAGINWDYNHQDEWLIAENVYVSGNLTFWSYAYQGSLHLDHYYVELSADQGNTWTPLLDLSALPPYPGSNGINDWQTPYHVDLSGYTGETVDIAWHAVDGDGNGLWYPWAIDDCTTGLDDVAIGTGRNNSGPLKPLGTNDLSGYDIYRRDNTRTEFYRINKVQVTDTTYTDSLGFAGLYDYFIQSRFVECEHSTNSDTIEVGVITSVDNGDPSGFEVFPNPAKSFIRVVASDGIIKAEMNGITGIPAGKWTFRQEKNVELDVRGVNSGIYLLNVVTATRMKVVKVCILRE